MNKKMIAYLLGRVFLAEFFLMIPSIAVGLIYSEKATLSFAIPMLVLLLAGLAFGLKKPKNTVIYVREGFFVVAAAWIFMSLIGAIPFYISSFEVCGGVSQFSSIWDCIFEMVSGFTTTGATICTDPGALPKCLLFWRSFSHWVGGMGVLVFVLAIMPMSDSMHLMKAEVPGPVVGKLVPRMRQTAIILYAVYAVLTVILAVLLLLGDMPLFDALCNAFGTAGTGGFAVRSEGISFYDSAYIEMVLAVFMVIFGINFNLFYLILIKRIRDALSQFNIHSCLLAFLCSRLPCHELQSLFLVFCNHFHHFHHFRLLFNELGIFCDLSRIALLILFILYRTFCFLSVMYRMFGMRMMLLLFWDLFLIFHKTGLFSISQEQ